MITVDIRHYCTLVSGVQHSGEGTQAAFYAGGLDPARFTPLPSDGSSEHRSQLRAEAEFAACHLLSIVGLKALVLGHGEGGLPVPCDTWGRGEGSTEAGGPGCGGGAQVLRASSTTAPHLASQNSRPGGHRPFLMKAEMLWSMMSTGAVL